MNVKLIGVTAPTEDNMTAEEMIVYMARVSNPANQKANEAGYKLINYLIKNSHWSPFEMVSIVVEINTTRDIARQILRHRSFSFQEFSQRYADPTKSMEFHTREARLQDTKNRQNSIEVDNADLQSAWTLYQNEMVMYAEKAYQWAIENGIAKEQARVVLPEGLTGSRLYMAGTLRSWIHYCQLRMGNGTQKEHAEIAKQCWTIIGDEFPNVAKALEQ
mgnify:CR=1 FL=1